MMTWILNAVGVFLITVGALLIFLHLYHAPRVVGEWQASEQAQQAYARNRMLLIVAVGLLAAWLVLQCLALILL